MTQHRQRLRPRQKQTKLCCRRQRQLANKTRISQGIGVPRNQNASMIGERSSECQKSVAYFQAHAVIEMLLETVA